MTSRSAAPQLQLDTLRKILKLEETKGYNDTAVIGGLDSYLGVRGPDILDLTEEDVQRLLKAPYARLTAPQRRKWVARWLDRLEAEVHREGAASRTAESQPTVARVGVPSVQHGINAELPSPPTAARSIASPGDRATRTLPVPAQGVTVEAPVSRLRGVDTKLSARLRRLGVSTIRELLYLFPRRHNDFSRVAKVRDLVPGEEQTIVATVWEARETAVGRGRLKATEAVLSDETGNVGAIWFGRPHVARVLKPNSRVGISGRVDVYKGQVQFQSPEYELLDRQEALVHTGRLVPVYPLTEGLTPRRLRSIVWQAVDQWAPRLEEFLPESIRSRTGLVALQHAITQAHYPDGPDSLEVARKRLAFDEFFLLQMAVLARRRLWREVADGVSIDGDPRVLETFLGSLPFSLTSAQQRCLGEALADMKRGTPPMNRLLQGEVGSGKTVVALAALLATAASGYQGSIMVPTEVLAEQHFNTVSRLLGTLARPVQEGNQLSVYLDPLPRPVSVALLTGGVRKPLRREILQRASEGALDIIIGTHALIQEGVELPRLALAVTDEQHRFGVVQRAALRQKGSTSPHVLAMSATPIPRTLALTLYGDLDISTIDELPPGRRRVETRYVPPIRRDAAYEFIRKQVRDGRQAFVVCPLIDESETVEAKAATEEYERLTREVFPDLRLGLLHGRMVSRKKDDVMRQFRDGEIDVLVSTPVVEVGIDMPNASVMMVEGAHRFGLAQLHQFRGRVGRGEHKSYCLLLSDYSSAEARERLSAVERIHDGFELAEVDLDMRGPGDWFGTRQSGLPSLRVARLSDQELLKMARDEAEQLLRDDPDLVDQQHAALSSEVSRFLEQVGDEVS